MGSLFGVAFVFIQMNPEITEQIKQKSIIGIPFVPKTEESNEFLAEFLGTFFITYVVISFLVEAKEGYNYLYGPCVGCVFYVCKSTLGFMSGGGFNPARSLAPAILVGEFTTLQFY